MGAADQTHHDTAIVAGEEAQDAGPRARELFRRGAVYGLAGLLKAGDVAAAAARSAARGAKAGASGQADPPQRPAQR